MGTAISRTQIEFSDEEIRRIGDTFRAWCNGDYEDVDGFCRSVSREEIGKDGDSLSPGRYIGTEETEPESDESFDERMQVLSKKLFEQFASADKLRIVISKNMETLGYGNG